MRRNEAIYTTLCVLFCVLVVVGNLIYQKFVSLPFFSYYICELSAGAIVYPLTFLLTDLITEFYGKIKANFCVKLGVFMNILVASLIVMVDQFDATPWSKINDTTFHEVFGLYYVSFVGSVIAFYIAQSIDIIIYIWIRRITKGKWLWLRNNGSTAVSLFVDTFIVVTFMTAFNIISRAQLVPLLINSYGFKLFFVVLSTPFFYLFVGLIRKLQGKRWSQKRSATPHLNEGKIHCPM